MNKPRLIDANELKNALTYPVWRPEWVHIRDKVLEDIDAQPTAYNVEGVVEQLEEKKALHERLAEHQRHIGTPYKRKQHERAVKVLTEAIEIVKGGAVDDETMA